jgi:5-methyltetrahydrofolate--homocysteine methyltransferase
MYEIWTNDYSLPPEDIIFDPLTFSIGSGDKTLIDSAVETLNAIKMIKEKLNGAKTVLGLSNVSFGLSPASRVVLNSVFLNRAVEAGLDMAIVHASKVLPDAAIDSEKRNAAMDLIYGKTGALEKFIEIFSNFKLDENKLENENLSNEEILKNKLKKGDKSDLEKILDKLLEDYSPYDIINTILLEAMKEVGVLFGEGKMLLPFVLQSAEVMKLSVSYLEKFMDKKDVEPKGKVILATVKGDVHDIGKNLVEIILSNNGYKVRNLGIKVPVDDMIKAAIEEKADAIGMSGLLVQSTVYMKENVIEIAKNNLNLKVLLGGAALTEGFVKNECNPILPGNVFYCSDAFDALTALDKGNDELISKSIENKVTEFKKHKIKNTSKKIRSNVQKLEVIPKPHFMGYKTITKFDLDEVLKYMNKQALFSRRWGFTKKRMSSKEYDEMIKNIVIPDYKRIISEVKKNNPLEMKAVYGFFKAYSKENTVFIEKEKEVFKIEFPRQDKENGLCLADYLREKDDIIAVQVVTVGQKPLDFALKIKEEGSYKDYFLYHGFFSELAEAMAEYMHTKIRKDWNISYEDARTIDGILNGKFRGQRFSFGYASCPDMFGNSIISKLLDMEENINVKLTDSYEMVPEYSTSAIIFHHPEAVHFII